MAPDGDMVICQFRVRSPPAPKKKAPEKAAKRERLKKAAIEECRKSRVQHAPKGLQGLRQPRASTSTVDDGPLGVTKILVLDEDAETYGELVTALARDAGHSVEVAVARSVDDVDAIDKAEVVLAQPNLAAIALARGLAPTWLQSTWAGVRPLVDELRQWTQRARPQLTGVKQVFGPLVSEHVFAYALADVRGVDRYRDAQRLGHWLEAWPGTLNGQTMTIVGTGSIGSHVATTARHFQMRVRGVSRSGKAVAPFDRVWPTAELESAIEGADYVVLCLPDTPETEQLVDTTIMAAMGERTTLFNVGRGSTLDHCALVAAMRRGRPWRAVLDVFPLEPLPENDPLWRQPNVVITPHVAAVSEPAAIAKVFASNLDRYLRGEPLEGSVDLEAGY